MRSRSRQIDAQVERRRIQRPCAMRNAERPARARPLPQPVGKIGTDGIGEISRRRLTQPAQQVSSKSSCKPAPSAPVLAAMPRRRFGAAPTRRASRERLRRSTANRLGDECALGRPGSGGCGSSRTGPGPPVLQSDMPVSALQACAMTVRVILTARRVSPCVRSASASSTSTMRTGGAQLGGEPDLRDVSRAFLAADYL